MIKGKKNNMGKAQDMGVINQRKENIRKIMQNTKLNEHKKKAQQESHPNTCPQMKG